MRLLSLPPPGRWGRFRRAVTFALVVSMGLGVVTAPEAWAATLNVSTAGTDSGNCQGSACRTIGYALGQASYGDDIQVAAGTYNAAGGESFPLTMVEGVALIGSTSDPTTRVISAPAGSNVCYTSQDLDATTRIAGFTLTHDAGTTSDIMEFDVGADTVRLQIDHNRFVGYHPSFDNLGIYVLDDSSSSGEFTATVDNNTFTSLDWGLGIDQSSGGSSDNFSPVITNNTFTGNGSAMFFWASSWAEGEMSPVIRDNTFTGCSDGDDILEFDVYELDYPDGYAMSPTISGNTFTNNPNADDDIDFEFSSVDVSSTATFSPTITNNTHSSGSGSEEMTLYYYDLGNGTYVSNVTIEGNTVTAGGGDPIFFSFSSNSDCDSINFDWTVSNNSITGTSGSDDGIDFSLSEYNSSISGTFDITVAGNTISAMDDDGIDFDLSSWDSADIDFSLTIQGNTVTGCTNGALSLNISDVSSFSDLDVSITDNVFMNNGGTGMYLYVDDYDDDTTTVSCNTITGNGANGIYQESQNDPLPDFGGGALSSPGNNTLVGNGDLASTFDFYNNDSETAMAENNWWGDLDPSNQVSGSVDYDPWATAVPVVSLSIPLVDAVTVDVLPVGASVGDTVTYTATVSSGASDDCSNSAVVFTAPIPANAGVVPGSATSTIGNIVSEDPVVVNLGVLQPNTTVTITWQVIPTSGSSMSTQGTVNAGKTGATPSDDPDTGTADDPTVTAFVNAEPIPTLAEWGLLLFAGALLLLGAGLLRRRRYLAASLVAAVALSAGWAGAAPPNRGGHGKAKEKRASEMSAATVSQLSERGRDRVLTLSNGTSIDLRGVELTVRDARFKPARSARTTPAERAAHRAEGKALRSAHRDEIRAARRNPRALLSPGTPVLTRVTYGEHGEVKRATVEVFSSHQLAQQELQRRIDQEKVRQQRREARR